MNKVITGEKEQGKMRSVLPKEAPSKDSMAEAEEALGKAVVSELRADEVEAILEELRSYPYDVTQEATEEFWERLTLRFDRVMRIPTLTPTQEDLNHLPEKLASRVARDRPGVPAKYSRIGEVKTISNIQLSILQGYAIWDWNAKEEQILPVEAFLRFLSTAHLWKPIMGVKGVSVSPSNVAFAALAPGAEHSEFVAKAWSITRVLHSTLEDVASGERAGVLGRWASALTGLCFHEIRSTLGTLEGRWDGKCAFTLNPAAEVKEKCNPLITAFTMDEVRTRWLDEVGAAYLRSLIDPRLFPGEIMACAMERCSGVGAQGGWNDVVGGARDLLELYPCYGEKKAVGITAERGNGDPFLLPLEFLLSLPSLDVSVLGEFHVLVEEYNEEWAMASFDWSKVGK